MLFQLAFEASLGLFLGAFVGYLPFVLLKAWMAKKSKKVVEATVDGMDMNAIMNYGAKMGLFTERS